MIIAVRVYTRAKKSAVTKMDVLHYRVHVNVVPEKGKANERVIAVLADFFDCAKSSIHIVKGETRRDKMIEVAL